MMASYNGGRWTLFIEDFPQLTTRVSVPRRRHARTATEAIATLTGRHRSDVDVEIVIGRR